MSAMERIRTKINSFEFLVLPLGASLSFLLIGFALSGIFISVFLVFSFRYFVINKDKTTFRLDRVLVLPILLYLYFVLTYFWSVDIDQTIKGIGRTIILLLVPIAFTIIPEISYRNYRLVLDVFTWSNCFLGVVFLSLAFYNFIDTLSLSVFTYHNLVSILDLNAIYVSLLFSSSFFYLLSLKKRTKLEKWMLIFLLILICLLSSKIMVLILFIGSFIFLLKHKFYKVNRKKIIIGISILIVVISISSITVFKRFSVEKNTDYIEVLNKKTFGKVYYWTGSSIRLFQLRILKEQLQEEGIFLKGFGLFASRGDIKKRHKQYDTYHVFHQYNYHNQYAQILSETGIMGLVILLVMLFTLIVKAIKSKDLGFIMFSVIMILFFFTESVLWRQRGLFLFIIFYCLFIRTSFTKKSVA